MNLNQDYAIRYKPNCDKEYINNYDKAIIKNKSITSLIIKMIVLINGLMILIILLSLVSKTSSESLNQVLTADLWPSFIISFSSVVISNIIVVMIGIPISYTLATKKGRSYRLLETLTCLPMVLPPTVAGLALLMTFGKRGIIGGFLSQFGISIPFTFIAVIIAQVFIISPYFIQLVKNGFLGISPTIIEAAKVCGAGEKQILFNIYIPLARRSICTGLVLCSLRAFGEFGATIMLAGNMVGKTQTITLRIYSLYQSDIIQSVNLAVLQMGFILLFFSIFIRKENSF
ncbi:MAG: molybdate ABC transporter permease subunit [Eubacteriales bacterium]